MLQEFKDRITKATVHIHEAVSEISCEADVIFGAEPSKLGATPRPPPHSIESAIRELEDAVIALREQLSRFRGATGTATQGFSGRRG
jgi:hypothetical protein